MQNQNADKESGPKRKNRKDYLYKIGKLKQNKILCEKTSNDPEYTLQPAQQAIQQLTQHLDQQLDFQFTLPTPTSSTNPKTQPTSFPELGSKNVNDSHPLPNNNVEQNIQNSPKKQLQPQQIIATNQSQEKVETQRQILINYKPITFDDFDEDLPIQQQSENGMVANKDKVEDKCDKPKEVEESQESSSCSEQEIKGVNITSNSLQGNVVIKITNKKQLVLSRLPPGIILKCIIRRSTDIFNPEFDFYLNNGLKHMMSAKKYSLAKKEIFKLSLELGRYRDRDVIGSIMANTLHNTYWIYKETILKQQTEYQIKGTIKFDKLIKNRERQMTVDLVVEKNKEINIEPDRVTHVMLENADLKLKNSALQTKQSSSKNYQLFDEEDKKYQYLKMNKVSDHMFEVQIQHPLSPLQAFAISLTRFDAQLK